MVFEDSTKGLLYPDFDDLLRCHELVINISGGLDGVRDENLLRGPLELITYDRYYKTFAKKISHLVYTIAKNHGFVDGNKRTAIAVGAFFMEINMFPQQFVDAFFWGMENPVLLASAGLISKSELEIIANDLIVDGKFSSTSEEIIAGIDPSKVQELLR